MMFLLMFFVYGYAEAVRKGLVGLYAPMCQRACTLQPVPVTLNAV